MHSLDAMNTQDIPPLPEGVQFDPGLGDGAGAWVDTYISYARVISPMTPFSFHESAALWLASVAIARRLVLNMPFGEVFPNLFVLWIALTTLFRKSTALNVARNLARDSFPFLLAVQDTTPEAFLSDMAGKKPTFYEHMTQAEHDTWRLERNHAGQRGWLLDEMSGLLAASGKDYNQGLTESLLRFYDCDPYFSRSTRAQGRVTVRNSCLSILGASTPAAISSHLGAERLWGMGWWPRFAILTPEIDQPKWREPKYTARLPVLVAGLRKLYDRLPVAAWPNPPQTLAVTISTEAFDAWKQYNRALSYDLLTSDLDRRLYGTYGRLPAHALKVAMILAALDWENDPAPRIELTHFGRAISITEEWRRSAHRAISNAMIGVEDILVDKIKAVLIRNEGDWVSRRDLLRTLGKRWSEIYPVINDLVASGTVERKSTKGSHGPESEEYRLLA